MRRLVSGFQSEETLETFQQLKKICAKLDRVGVNVSWFHDLEAEFSASIDDPDNQSAHSRLTTDALKAFDNAVAADGALPPIVIDKRIEHLRQYV